MKLAGSCSSSHEDCYGCDYVLLDLTPVLARLLLERIDQVRHLQFMGETGLAEMSYWSETPEFFSPHVPVEKGRPTEEEKSAVIKVLSEADEWIEVPDGFGMPDTMLVDSDCNQMIVGSSEVRFTCQPAHADGVTVTTPPLSRACIEAALAQAPPESSATVRAVLGRHPSMVVESGSDHWKPLTDMGLVFLPEETDDYNQGGDASSIIEGIEFRPPCGVFDLEQLVLDLPLATLERYRLAAGKKEEE